MRKRLILAAVIIVIVVATAATAFVWNEARKEIKFLCPNFAPGVTQQSVVTQLDTGTFLRYQVTSTRIIADSAYNVGLYRCVIELDDSARVIEAKYD
ncbi:hypothetical protein PHACT_08465 [Pseudohongiella acticola]|uniref:Uncharacterized protein n=1 Tax=Pseudohongiella acticola TaxID=1524254 RepID=A0A1E8CL36_9GAMM|nr:hypothetical protein [Pseudohongiella acticola]OFE13170.1 hypothetical protein PHACT_08465 [Pseudohongiella acticola]